MGDRYHNPFQAFDISVPEQLHETAFLRFCQRTGSQDVDKSPFPRMIDLWFLALAVAVRMKLRPAELPKGKTVKIIDGAILSSDPWRIHALMLIALGVTKKEDVVSRPAEIMAMATGLAAAGLPHVVEMLTDEDGDEIWNLSDALVALLDTGTQPGAPRTGSQPSPTRLLETDFGGRL